MVINDNGFDVTTISYEATRDYVSEGAVVGIVFGWIIAIIGFYILGVCLISRCISDEDDESDTEKKPNN